MALLCDFRTFRMSFSCSALSVGSRHGRNSSSADLAAETSQLLSAAWRLGISRIMERIDAKQSLIGARGKSHHGNSEKETHEEEIHLDLTTCHLFALSNRKRKRNHLSVSHFAAVSRMSRCSKFLK
jgi:hypothetical protein